MIGSRVRTFHSLQVAGGFAAIRQNVPAVLRVLLGRFIEARPTQPGSTRYTNQLRQSIWAAWRSWACGSRPGVSCVLKDDNPSLP